MSAKEAVEEMDPQINTKMGIHTLEKFQAFHLVGFREQIMETEQEVKQTKLSHKIMGIIKTWALYEQGWIRLISIKSLSINRNSTRSSQSNSFHVTINTDFNKFH